MTPAQEIREAAALMRQRAGAATPGPWRDSDMNGNRYGALVSDTMPAGRSPDGGWDVTDHYGGYLVGESLQPQDRQHIASWHPAVALAVADWLDYMGLTLVFDGQRPAAKVLPPGATLAALAVARAYMGTAPAGAP